MSSVLEKDVLKIFCSECNAKMDVSDSKSFSTFPCPVCENIVVVPKRFGELILTKKLSQNNDFESYLALRDEKVVVVKIIKNKVEKLHDIQNFLDELDELDGLNAGFTLSKIEGQSVAIRPAIFQSLEKNFFTSKPVHLAKSVAIFVNFCQQMKEYSDKRIYLNSFKPGNLLSSEKGDLSLSDSILRYVLLEDKKKSSLKLSIKDTGRLFNYILFDHSVDFCTWHEKYLGTDVKENLYQFPWKVKGEVPENLRKLIRKMILVPEEVKSFQELEDSFLPILINLGKSKEKEPGEKSIKDLSKKEKKTFLKSKPIDKNAQLISTQARLNLKSKKKAIVILGALAVVLTVALIVLPESLLKMKKLEVSQENSPDERALELSRERERENELALQSAKDQNLKKERALQLLKAQELEKERELQAEKARKEESVRLKEEGRQKDLDEFLTQIKPSEEQLKKFASLPKISSANLKIILNKHCVECHNKKKSKGDLNLDIFHSPSSIYSAYDIVKHASESIAYGEMPPEDDDISEQERSQLKSYFQKLVYTLESKPANIRKTALIRRLTPYEYDNTVEAITGLDLKFGEAFPGDGGGNQGFANDSNAMRISPLLMEKYLEAAEDISSYSFLDIDKGISFSHGVMDPPTAENFEAGLRKKIYGSLSSYYPAKFNVEKMLPNLMKAVAELYLNSSNRESVEAIAKRYKIHKVFVQQGKSYFTSSAGKSDIENKALKKWRSLKRGKIDKKNLDEAIKEFISFYKSSDFSLINRQDKDRKKHVGIVKNIENIFRIDQRTAEQELQGSRYLAYEKLFDLYDYSRFAFNSLAGKKVSAQVSPFIRKFLYKMYRRPPSQQELSTRTKDFMDDSIIYGMPIAARILVIREFSSLNFLFRIESKESSVINDYDLASRLSYFLWAAPPDEELLTLASKAELKKEAKLLAQVDRMLKDKKSARLAKHFANQWLHIGDIFDVQGPSKEVFRGFDKSLANDMWQETAMCFNYIVKNDRSILEILDADYTIINNRLGKLYGLNQPSHKFQKISIKNDKRGGILGHASFLTMTSLGERTSPIIRGNWVLTTLLGESTPPPPMNVPALPKKEVVTEDFTLEQQLAQHRDDPACKGCHKKIDPLGMVLENFDTVGRWRERYTNAPIHTASKIDGDVLKGPADLKRYLRKHKVSFIRNLSRKMVSYALGRSIYFYDNYLVNQMIESSIRNNYKFSSLVKAVVLSPQFQHK